MVDLDLANRDQLVAHNNQKPIKNRNDLSEVKLCSEVQHVLDLGRGNRSFNLIVPEVTASVWTGDLHNQHWKYVVPYGMREAIDIRMQDISTTTYLKVGHAVRKRKHISINLDKLRKRKRLALTNRSEAAITGCELSEDKFKMLIWQMRSVNTKRLWTQGGILAFDAGDMITSADKQTVISVLNADRMGFDVGKGSMDYGFVRFEMLKKTGNGEQLKIIDTATLNQPEFLNFLIKGTK